MNFSTPAQDTGQPRTHSPIPIGSDLHVETKTEGHNITNNGPGNLTLNAHYGHNIWTTSAQVTKEAPRETESTNCSIRSSRPVKTANEPNPRTGVLARITRYLSLVLLGFICRECFGTGESVSAWIPNPSCVAWKTVFRLLVSQRLHAIMATTLFTSVVTLAIIVLLSTIAHKLSVARRTKENKPPQPIADAPISQPSPSEELNGGTRPTTVGLSSASHPSALPRAYTRDAPTERPLPNAQRARQVPVQRPAKYSGRDPIPINRDSRSMGSHRSLVPSADSPINSRTPLVQSSRHRHRYVDSDGSESNDGLVQSNAPCSSSGLRPWTLRTDDKRRH